jgi:alkylhydroperoxidase family enzyme
MPRIPYVTDEAVSPQVRAVFEASQRDFGILFNTYRILAHRPEVLEAWHHLLGTVLGTGRHPQLRMLAFTAGSQANSCVY